MASNDDDLPSDNLDPAKVLANLEKMFDVSERRKRTNAFAYAKPHPGQLAALNSPARHLQVLAGNQYGKSWVAGILASIFALNRRPHWYTGPLPHKSKSSRVHDCIIWVCSTTATKVRDGLQTSILGNVLRGDGLGTGMLPLDSIIEVVGTHGHKGAIDQVIVRRDDGGSALIKFLSYEQNVSAFAGAPVDLIICDEDFGYDQELLNEMLARFATTGGRLVNTMTPTLGKTPLRQFFEQGRKDGSAAVFRASALDNPYIPDAEKAEIKKRFTGNAAQTRIYGFDAAGAGRVYDINLDSIKHNRSFESFPPYWRFGAGMDIPHGGLSEQASKFAWVSGCFDVDKQTLYVMEAYELAQMLPIQHFQVIKNRSPVWDVPAFYGSDAEQRANAADGTTFASFYRELGFNMAGHATLPPSKDNPKGGGNSVEGGINIVYNAMTSGRLLIHQDCTELFDALAEYHRDDQLRVVKQHDDLVDALRYCAISTRGFRPLAEYGHAGDTGKPRAPQFWGDASDRVSFYES